MKTVKTILASLILVFMATFMVRAEKPAKKVHYASQAISCYIQARELGQVEPLQDLLSSQFVAYSSGKPSGHKRSKTEFVKQLSLSKDVKMNCNSQLNIVEQGDDFVLARIDFNFPEFTRSDYLTLHKSGEDWEITGLSVQYKE